MVRYYHVVLFAGGMISAQPAHGVFSVPLHHFPALWTRIPAQVRGQRLELPQHQLTLTLSVVIYLESIIFLAASAYLNSNFRASSLYLIRDNLRDTHRY